MKELLSIFLSLRSMTNEQINRCLEENNLKLGMIKHPTFGLQVMIENDTNKLRVSANQLLGGR